MSDSPSPQASESIRVGTARSVITPPLGVLGTWRLRSSTATAVHDELMADALVIERSGTQLALVSLDLVAVDAAFSGAVRSRASERTGIPADAIIVNASHNHSAPAWPLEPAPEGSPLRNWGESLIDRVVGCIEAAHRTTRPARIGLGYVAVSGLAVNRVWPEQPVDDRVTVIRIDAEDDAPILTVLSLACHALTVGGHTTDWTADFPGSIRRHLEDALPGSRAMFLQGAAGDMAPFDYWFGNPDPQPMGFATMDQFGAEVAGAAVAARARIRTSANVDLDWGAAPLTLQRRQVPWSAEEIRLAREAAPTPDVAALPPVWPCHLHTVNSAQTMPDFYVDAALTEFEGLLDHGGSPLETTLRAVRLGSLTILATPFELFSDLAFDVARSQDGRGQTLVLGYCDDYLGYFPPDGGLGQIAAYTLDDQLDQDKARWAYGITNTQIADGEGQVFVRAATSLIDAVRDQ
ncbi:MAG: hypothetical protein QOJ68_240 [Blastococcus sp.]|nr:hypothetical protein [Blastococcus sp.]